MDKLIVKMDLTDWLAEYSEDEASFHNEGDVLDRLKMKHPAQVAREVIVAREVGAAKEDIVPGVKIVPNAYARIVDLELQGYAYIRF